MSDESNTRPARSAIFGEGHGSCHTWARLGSAQVGSAPAWAKRTDYRCVVCGADFAHYYDLEFDIFTAMRRAGVSAECSTG